MTPDAAVTAITNATNETAARIAMAGMPLALLRAVADLTYAVDYPDTTGRRKLTDGIVAAARSADAPHAFVESGPGQEPTTLNGCIVCPDCYQSKGAAIHTATAKV